VLNAIESAHTAKEPLRKVGVENRVRYLAQLRQKLEENQEFLARLECLDNGKTICEARGDIQETISCFKTYEALGHLFERRINGHGTEILNPANNSPDDMFHIVRSFMPVGVSVAILPFNYPLTQISWALCPSIIAGCPIIVKPSENTMLTSFELARYVQEITDMPKGSINIVYGDGKQSDALQLLTEDERINKVAFTGSVATGKKIAQKCAERFIRFNAETGGKSPMIVDESYFTSEADYDKCVEWIMTGIISNKGEICSATSRLIVHTHVYDKLLQRLKDRIEKLWIEATCPDEDADNLFADDTCNVKASQTHDRKSELGPVISEIQYEKVWRYIGIAKKEGCKLLCGGSKNNLPKEGFFVAPTVFYDVNKDHTIWKEEVFGPVLAACSYDTIEEAIDLATDSWNGLTSSVFTKDEDLFRRVKWHLRTGTVWWNSSQPNFAYVPWGGFGASGTQGRVLGEEGLFNYLEVQSVYSNRENATWGNFIQC